MANISFPTMVNRWTQWQNFPIHGPGNPTMIVSTFLSVYRLRTARLLITMGVSASYVALRQLRISDDSKDVSRVDRLRQYEDIFIKVKSWGKFERSDIEGNHIWQTSATPDHVTAFEQMLVEKPVIRPRVRRFLDLSIWCSVLTGQCRCVLDWRC